MKEAGKEEIEGKDIFKLYDTYGFPVELTEEYAEDEGLKVDHAGFEAEMEMQRNRARSARSDEKSMNVQTGLLADVKIDSEFIGYDKTDAVGTLELIVAEDALVDSVKTGSEAQLIFNQTPFYAEMGGQVADIGVIKNKDGETVAKVTSVKKAPSGQPLHFVDVLAELKLGEEYELVVDQVARRKITRNHTATNLLHRALKDILGDHANQAGSLVAPHYLRFDFTHFGQITAKELVEMERIVNEKIWASLPVVTVETGINEAKEMGAMALFGEKYGEMVRVVNVDGYSIELCGGVHVSNTSEIGIFKILSESGIGAGVRRIEAVTSEEAYLALFEEQTRLNEVAALVKAPQTTEVPTKVSQLLMELKEVQKENESLQAKLANEQAGEVFKEIQDISGVSVVTAQVEVKDMNGLRQLADQWKQNNISDVLVLGSVQDGKVSLLAAVSEETIKKGLKAGDLIKEIAPLVGGGGGGRPDMAQAGGKNPAGLADALASVNQWVEAKI